MMKIKSICEVIAASLNAAPCFAQTSNIDEAFLRGSEARATITIPFGGSKRSQKDKPRLEFGIRQYQNQSSSDWMLNSTAAQNYGRRENDFIESKIGFTLSNETALLVNGREMETNREELGLVKAQKSLLALV